jgi:hypothetical protein
MPDLTWTVARLDDAAVVKLFRDLRAKFSPYDASASLVAINSTINLNADQPTGLFAQVNRPNSFVLHSAQASFRHLTLRWWRGGDNKNNPWFDEIKFQRTDGNQGGELTDQQRIEIIDFVTERLQSPVPLPASAATDSVGQIETLYKSTILKLESSFAHQLERLTSWGVEQASEFERRKLELAEETKRERERLQAEHEAKTRALSTASEELEQRKKELDDRDYMHARRGLRSDLQRIIANREEKFALTKNTRSLRVPIHFAMCGLILALLYVNVFYFRLFGELDLSASSPFIIVGALVRQGLVAIALVGAILYYVRWMNRWFDDHAQTEFRLKQFQLDIDRASWVVETALEWRRAEKSEIPTALLDGVTRNLFSPSEAKGGNHSAADDLASALVGQASAVKVKVGDSEISLDRKGLQGLAKKETE